MANVRRIPPPLPPPSGRTRPRLARTRSHVRLAETGPTTEPLENPGAPARGDVPTPQSSARAFIAPKSPPRAHPEPPPLPSVLVRNSLRLGVRAPRVTNGPSSRAFELSRPLSEETFVSTPTLPSVQRRRSIRRSRRRRVFVALLLGLLLAVVPLVLHARLRPEGLSARWLRWVSDRGQVALAQLRHSLHTVLSPSGAASPAETRTMLVPSVPSTAPGPSEAVTSARSEEMERATSAKEPTADEPVSAVPLVAFSDLRPVRARAPVRPRARLNRTEPSPSDGIVRELPDDVSEHASENSPGED